jgi:hypothetical protein
MGGSDGGATQFHEVTLDSDARPRNAKLTQYFDRAGCFPLEPKRRLLD